MKCRDRLGSRYSAILPVRVSPRVAQQGGLRVQGDSQGVLAAFALQLRTYLCTYPPIPGLQG